MQQENVTASNAPDCCDAKSKRAAVGACLCHGLTVRYNRGRNDNSLSFWTMLALDMTKGSHQSQLGRGPGSENCLLHLKVANGLRLQTSSVHSMPSCCDCTAKHMLLRWQVASCSVACLRMINRGLMQTAQTCMPSSSALQQKAEQADLAVCQLSHKLLSAELQLPNVCISGGKVLSLGSDILCQLSLAIVGSLQLSLHDAIFQPA